MEWDKLIAQSFPNGEPKTLREHVEAVQRIIQTLVDEWDNLPDGNGSGVFTDPDQVVTKTDLIDIIGGTCWSACELIAWKCDLHNSRN